MKRLAIAVLILALPFGGALAMQRYTASGASGTPLTLIGVSACDKFIGAVVVTRDGETHPLPPAYFGVASKLAGKLPKGHAIMIHVPCGSEI